MSSDIQVGNVSSHMSGARFFEAQVGEILQLKDKIQILDQTDSANYEVFFRYDKYLQEFFTNVAVGQQKVGKRDIALKETKTTARKNAISFIYPENDESLKDELRFGCLGSFWVSFLSCFGFKWAVAQYVEQFAYDFFNKLAEDPVVQPLLHLQQCEKDFEEAQKRQQDCLTAFQQAGRFRGMTQFDPTKGKQLLRELTQAGEQVRIAKITLRKAQNACEMQQMREIIEDAYQAKQA